MRQLNLKKATKTIFTNKSRGNLLKCCRQQKHLLSMTIVLVSTILIAYATTTITLVECQDSSFDQDLSQQQQHPSAASSFLSRQSTGNNNNNQHAINSRHQLSRLSSQQQNSIQSSGSNVNLQQQQVLPVAAAAAIAPVASPVTQQLAAHPNRPLLSSRFSAAQSPLAFPASTFQASQQPMATAASSPVASQQQQQQQQSRLPPQQTNTLPTSNIEQMMRSAISRSGANEPISRQQLASPAILTPVASAQTAILQQPQQQELRRESNESPIDNNNKPTSAAATAAAAATTIISDDSTATTAANGNSDSTQAAHETVYSDQRFANLFARRQNLRKSRLVPTEQAKAKPTLPSFIKSLPDPKQFPSTPTVDQERASASQLQSSPANAFLSQRVQAANQKALASLQAQSSKIKPIINSNSPNASISKIKPNAKSPSGGSALANNVKPIKQTASTSSSDSSSSSRVKGTPSNLGNPFASRPNNHHNNQASSSENIIATARKRLLANNALEAAKLKKAEQSQQ